DLEPEQVLQAGRGLRDPVRDPVHRAGARLRAGRDHARGVSVRGARAGEALMAEGDVLLDVKDVHLELGGNLILQGVTFQVKDRVQTGKTTGQIVALLG